MIPATELAEDTKWAWETDLLYCKGGDFVGHVLGRCCQWLSG